VPAPALKLEMVNWYGDDDTAPEVVLTPFSPTPPALVVVVVLVELDDVVVDVELTDVVVVDVGETA